MNFKATIRKLAGLSFEEISNLLKWVVGGNIELDNSSLLVASATDVKGKSVGYLTAEPVLTISNYAVDPRTAFSDVQQIGDSIDAALAERAAAIGAERFMIVMPDGAPHLPGERLLRVFYRKISLTYSNIPNEKRFSVDAQTNSAKFIN